MLAIPSRRDTRKLPTSVTFSRGHWRAAWWPWGNVHPALSQEVREQRGLAPCGQPGPAPTLSTGQLRTFGPRSAVLRASSHSKDSFQRVFTVWLSLFPSQLLGSFDLKKPTTYSSSSSDQLVLFCLSSNLASGHALSKRQGHL